MPDKKHLYISVMAYDGAVKSQTVDCIIKSMVEAQNKGWEITVDQWVGDSLIARARNGAVARFMRSTATDLIFVDSDVAWDDGALCRLAEHPVDVVGGCYPLRRDPEEYYVMWKPGEFLIADDATGLLEVDALPGGFLKLSRACLNRMSAYYADRVYHDPTSGKTLCLFDCELHEGIYWGEDTTFCRRWRTTDGKVWLDPELKLYHIGTKVFEGHIGNWLRNRPPVVRAA